MSDNARFILIMTLITAIAVIIYGITHPHNAVERKKTPLFGHVETMTYNGHEYIVFKRGVVHNPDCPCKKKGE